MPSVLASSSLPQSPNTTAPTFRIACRRRADAPARRYVDPIAAAAARMVREDPVAAGLGERIDLEVEPLVRRRDACLANNHAPIVPKLVLTTKRQRLISRHSFRTPHVQVKLGEGASFRQGS